MKMNQTKEVLLTGDCPYGGLHLGHYIGSLKTRVSLQSEFDSFFLITDFQALQNRLEIHNKITENVYTLMAEYLAVGLSEKNTYVVQSQVTGLARIGVLVGYFTSLRNIQRKALAGKLITEKSSEANTAFSTVTHPVSQAADILAFKSTIIPGGKYQIPLVEFTRKIAKKFNSTYEVEYFPLPKVKASNCPDLIGIDGENPMSRSLGNAIYLSDSNEIIEQKVKKIKSNPRIENNTTFIYHRLFNPDTKIVRDLEARYTAGEIGDKIVKDELISVLQKFISPIREKRDHYLKDTGYLNKILERGTKKGEEVVATTMTEMEKIMGLDYGWR